MMQNVINIVHNNKHSWSNIITKDELLLEYIKTTTSFLDDYYQMIPLPQRIWHIVNNNFNIQKCQICGNPLNYVVGKHYRIHKECLSKFVQNKNKNKSDIQKLNILNKIKQTSIEKYGVDNYAKTEECTEKSNIILTERYGGRGGRSNIILNKMMSTQTERYGGVGNASPILLKKCIETSVQRYGGIGLGSLYTKENNFKKTDFYKLLHNEEESIKYIENIGDGKHKLECKLCNKQFIQDSGHRYRLINGIHICPYCNKLDNGKGFSFQEKQILNFVYTICDYKIYENFKFENIKYDKWHNLDVDIYIPELNLAIEFNGVYWHSDKFKQDNHHKIKTELCESNGIRLIHILSSDWSTKRYICKSILQTAISPKLNNKIFARKCEIKEINDLIAQQFLIENHINGGMMNNKEHIGLYYNDELVSLMSFRKIKDYYELSRYAIKLNYTIVGGAEKLFKHFIRNNEFEKIITYCDISLFSGKIYERLGFVKIRRNRPNYKFVNKNYGLLSKQSIRKLKQGYKRENDPYPRIYNSGIDVYEYDNTTNTII